MRMLLSLGRAPAGASPWVNGFRVQLWTLSGFSRSSPAVAFGQRGFHSPKEAPRLLLTCVWMFLHPSPSTARGPAPRDEVGQGAGTGWHWGGTREQVAASLVKGATPTATPGKGAGAQHRAPRLHGHSQGGIGVGLALLAQFGLSLAIIHAS